jgi:hypothetical protein
MTHELSATQARTLAYSDLVVHNEIDTIARQVITDAGNGLNQSVINDGTTMTESTPLITVTGSVANPTFTPADQIQLAGQAIALGVDANAGTGLDQAIADINNAAIAGLTAGKNDADQLVLTYNPSQSAWTFEIGAGTGTANADLGLTAATTTATDPDSVDYYNAWTGAVDDRAISTKMTQVINHFQSLGYNILRKKNTTTNNTFYWEVYW